MAAAYDCLIEKLKVIEPDASRESVVKKINRMIYFSSKYHILLHMFRFLFFFADNIIADVASKQQSAALVPILFWLYSVFTVIRTLTELTRKLTNLMEKLSPYTFSSVYRTVFPIS
jgi:hypothetical protein